MIKNNLLSKTTRSFFCGAIKGYQWFIRPLLRGQCRFYPSCSHYAIEAFDRHGVRRGFILTAKRLSRCHPWGGHGVDPVPEHDNKQPSKKLMNSVKV